jgi:mycothiol system anti-sigma-R factor
MGHMPESVGDGAEAEPSEVVGHCADVMADVWRFLDDELDPDRRAAVRRHLDECSPCLEESGIDTKLKALLARKCGGDRAPEQLRARIAAAVIAWQADDATGVSIASAEFSVIADETGR